MFPPSLKQAVTPAPENPARNDKMMTPLAYHGQTGTSQYGHSWFDGQKFEGGMGPVELQTLDYWSLRARSSQFFNENLYARGIIRRLVTNTINTGLTPEACPDEKIIGLPDDSLQDWTELTENRFAIWAKDARLCDFQGKNNFGALQRYIELEALVAGDVLVNMRVSRTTGLPLIQLIGGDRVRTPFLDEYTIADGHVINHGVETDKRGKIVAHWITQEDLSYKRLPAYGARTGKRISWLVYGTDKRLDDIRGQPLIALIMQSLSEIDKYRDSAQRKALINSFLAMFVKKTQDKLGTLPITGGARRSGQVTASDTDQSRQYNISEHIPGLVVEELQVGEEPVGFDSKGTDVNFAGFEASIMSAIAWALEIPPEVLRLSFDKSYSASQAAINEFKIYLNLRWEDRGATFCQFVYEDWLIAESLNGKNEYADQLLSAWRDPSQYDVFGAWMACDWYGSIKPSTDAVKMAKGSKLLVDEGWSTNSREARINTGTKFSKNAKRLAHENKLKVEALQPLANFYAQYGASVDKFGDSVDKFGEPTPATNKASEGHFLQLVAQADELVDALTDREESL